MWLSQVAELVAVNYMQDLVWVAIFSDKVISSMHTAITLPLI